MDGMMTVQQCTTIFGILQSEALPPAESVELVRKAKDDLNGQQ